MDKFDIKLADFGFAKFAGALDMMASFCGTPITMVLIIKSIILFLMSKFDKRHLKF